MASNTWRRFMRAYGAFAAAAVLVTAGYIAASMFLMRLHWQRTLEADRAACYRDPTDAGRITMVVGDLSVLGEHRAAAAFAAAHLSGGPGDDAIRLAMADEEWAEGDRAAAHAQRVVVARSKSYWFAAEARYDLAHPDSGR
ncbi:MAG: hypothetical protein KGJ62_02955 [Armatimonadetes bacterium]|nr:hypothetical protein [Armatimonadota bacterium]MDE2205595.1 hypothetical protein [Armatimonadota bacterium]